MKRTFPLQAPGKDDARVRDKIRHEINKYVRRERRKEVPEGFAQWDFNCRVGATAEASAALPLKAVAGTIDEVAVAGASSVYVEITAVPGQRMSAG